MTRVSLKLLELARSTARLLVPTQVRRLIYVAHRTVWHEFVFRQAMRHFLEDPQACTRRESPTIARLIYGWDNPLFGAERDYLVGCISHTLNSRGPILECGSGLSTVLVGAIAKKRGQSHWVLEHNPEWAAKVQRYLDRYELDSVLPHPKPLKDYGEFHWYNVDLASMPDSFSLVLCDGPPYDTGGGRYGLAPIMADRLRPGCTILLDDAKRKQERAVAKRWETELDASSELTGSESPYFTITIADRENMETTGDSGC